MLNFLKPKIKVSVLANSYVSVLIKILSPEKVPAVSELITQLIERGADIPNIQIELAIFTIFTQWLGLATAVQKGHIPETLFEEVVSEVWRKLDAALSDTGMAALCHRERGIGFIDYAWERSELLIKISTEAPRSTAQMQIIDEVSGWLCSAEPPPPLKLAVLYQYVQNTGTVADGLAWARVVSS